MNNIIMITGEGRSGKNTVAESIKEIIKCEIIGNADKVWEIAEKQFNWNGERDNKGRQLSFDITEAGYNYDFNFFEKITHHKMSLHNNIKNFIIPDWRYIRTFEYFTFFNNVITVKVVRHGFNNGNSSSIKNDKWMNERLHDFSFDRIIVNDGTIQDLFNRTADLLSDYSKVFYNDRRMTMETPC